MTYRVWSLETHSWSDDRIEVSPADFSWSRTKNAGCSGSATFRLGDPAVAELAGAPNTLGILERLLVVEWDGVVVYAGLIIDHDYDRDTKTLTVQHADLWWLVAKRYVLSDYPGNGPLPAPLVIPNMTLATLATHVMYEGQNALPADRYLLPLVYTPDVAGSQSRTYESYNFEPVTDALDDLVKTEGGPDIDLIPRWVNGNQIEWFMRTSRAQQNTWEWNIGAHQSGVSGLRLRKSGGKMATKIIAVGEGTEAATLVQQVDNFATTTFPAIERVVSYKGISNLGELAARGRADLALASVPTQQASFKVLAAGEPTVAQLQLGDEVIWQIQGDPYIPDGQYPWQILQISGDLGDWVTLELQPIT